MIRILALFLAFVSPMYAASPYVVKDFNHLIGMPGFSDKLLTMHFKLYEGYVKTTNELLTQLQTLAKNGKATSPEYGAIKRRFNWEFDGMRLHELYFRNLGGKGNEKEATYLLATLIEQYGDFEQWKKEFVATGLMRGIGWVVLYRDPLDGRLLNVWINEHDVGHLATATPLLIMDVFEHAYMPQFGLDRAGYIEAFFANLDWKVPEKRFVFVSASNGPVAIEER